MVPVPSHAALPGEITCAVPALPPEILAVEVKFACEACNSKLGIDIRMAGLLVTCPVCSARIRAPRLGGMRGSLPGPAVSGTAATSLLSVAETEFLTGAGESPVKAVAAR
jgi:DNA-directed RNA polymerase subunit RPC12/RpoP